MRPIADWFHITMRFEHTKLATSGLSTEGPGRLQAKTAIITEVERLRWRILERQGQECLGRSRLHRQGSAFLQGRAWSLNERRGCPQIGSTGPQRQGRDRWKRSLGKYVTITENERIFRQSLPSEDRCSGQGKAAHAEYPGTGRVKEGRTLSGVSAIRILPS
jgi:hypothetical protein